MITRLKAYTETIQTPRVQELLGYINEEMQRKKNDAHARKLGGMMERGEYLTAHIVIAHLNGEKLIANGQHSLYAMERTGIPQFCFIEEYRCATREDYVRLFMAYDTEERRRTWGESGRVYKMTRADDIDATSLNQFRAGIEYLAVANGIPRVAKSRFDRFDILTNHAPGLALFKELQSAAVAPEHVRRSPCAAAIAATAQSGIEEARNFWHQVFTGMYPPGYTMNYPPKRLHHYISEVSIYGGSGSKRKLSGGGHLASQFDVYVACIRCWNAWCRGEDIVRLRTKGGAPKVNTPMLVAA